MIVPVTTPDKRPTIDFGTRNPGAERRRRASYRDITESARRSSRRSRPQRGYAATMAAKRRAKSESQGVTNVNAARIVRRAQTPE